MNDTIERIRSVDTEALSDEQFEVIRERLGIKVRDIVDVACDEANRLLKIYGLEAKMQIVIQEKTK